MTEYKTGCLVCGNELLYYEAEELECFYCHNIYTSKVKCAVGHFVCDQCHRSSGNDVIEKFCINTQLEDPLEIALILMSSPKITMHGPEHHFLVPAVLIAAYYNLKKDPAEKESMIREARSRASNILGGFCGFYGNCGAAVGTGIFISVITSATPLSIHEWKLSNLMTARSLHTIAKHGGPRCCKRNTFLAINEAITFLTTYFNCTMKTDQTIRCRFIHLNKECLKQQCPFYAVSS
jgi:hypothetical protein